jgi:hypothetical protein
MSRILTVGYELGLDEFGDTEAWSTGSVFAGFDSSGARTGRYGAIYNLMNANSGGYLRRIPLEETVSELYWRICVRASGPWYSWGPITSQLMMIFVGQNGRGQGVFGWKPGGNGGNRPWYDRVVLWDHPGDFASMNVATSGAELIPRQYHVLEGHVKFATDNTGLVSLKANGNTVAGAANVPTAYNDPNIESVWLGLRILGGGQHLSQQDAYLHLDDIAINSTTGPRHNSYPGFGGILILPPVADVETGFNPYPPGPHYQTVDELTADDETSFLSTQVPGRTLFDVADLPATVVRVDTVQMIMRAMASDPWSWRPLLVVNGTEVQGATQNTLDDGMYHNYGSEVYAVNPLTGKPWSMEEVNQLRLGLEVIDVL